MKTSTRILHWAPRILCILAILFISLFALDSFNPEYTIWKQLTAFFIHLIPSFILLALLIFTWKQERAGGFVFLLIGLAFSPMIYLHNFRMNQSVWMSVGIVMMVTLPFIIVGILFILSHYRKKSERTTV